MIRKQKQDNDFKIEVLENSISDDIYFPQLIYYVYLKEVIQTIQHTN